MRLPTQILMEIVSAEELTFELCVIAAGAVWRAERKFAVWTAGDANARRVIKQA